MLIICPECKHEISHQAKACPNCGYAIKKKNSLMIIVVIVVLAAITIAAFFGVGSVLISRRNKAASALTEKEQGVYEIMLEVCHKADDPSQVVLLESSTFQDEETGKYIGFIKVKASSQVYLICVNYKNGAYELSSVHDLMKTTVEEGFKDDDGIDRSKVQKEIDKRYG